MSTDITSGDDSSPTTPTDSCQTADANQNHVFLSAAMYCMKKAAEFAEQGFSLSHVVKTFDPQRDFCFGNAMRLHSDVYDQIKSKDIDISDAAAVDVLYRENTRFFLLGFKDLFVTAEIFVEFESLVKNTVTLPAGQMLVHQQINVFSNRPFTDKWKGARAMWFTPLLDANDAALEEEQENTRILNFGEAQWCMVSTRCVCGVVNIDATGFKAFALSLQKLCDGGADSADQEFNLNGNDLFTKDTCETTMKKFANTDSGNSEKDRGLPAMLHLGFSGWVLKCDETLERQVLLLPRARDAFVYWRFGMGSGKTVGIEDALKHYEQEKASAVSLALVRAFQLHITDVVDRAKQKQEFCSIWANIKTFFGTVTIEHAIKNMTKEELNRVLVHAMSIHRYQKNAPRQYHDDRMVVRRLLAQGARTDDAYPMYEEKYMLLRYANAINDITLEMTLVVFDGLKPAFALIETTMFLALISNARDKESMEALATKYDPTVASRIKNMLVENDRVHMPRKFKFMLRDEVLKINDNRTLTEALEWWNTNVASGSVIITTNNPRHILAWDVSPMVDRTGESFEILETIRQRLL